MSQGSSSWQAFVAGGRTLGPTPGAREAWHQGRPWYAVWALAIDDPRVRARADAVVGALAGQRVRPVKQLHVTVFVAGFPSLVASRDDDVGVVQLERQRRRVRAAAGPLALRIGGVTSFQTCAVLEVVPDGALEGLRAALAVDAREVRFAPYQPHVTAAIYDSDGPVAWIARALDPLRGLEPLVVRPSHLQLMVFDARVTDAPLLPIAGVPLG